MSAHINPLSYLEDRDPEIFELAHEGDTILRRLEEYADDPELGLDHPDYDRVYAEYEAKKEEINARLKVLGRRF